MGAPVVGRRVACGAALLGIALALVWGLPRPADVAGTWVAWVVLLAAVAAVGGWLVRVGRDGAVLRGVGGVAVALAAWLAAGPVVAGLVADPEKSGAAVVWLTAVPLLLAFAGLAAAGLRVALTGLGFVLANTVTLLTASDPLPALMVALAVAGLVLAGRPGARRGTATFGVALGASAVVTGMVGGEDLYRPVAFSPPDVQPPDTGSTGGALVFLVLALLAATLLTAIAAQRRDTAGTVLSALPLLLGPFVGRPYFEGTPSTALEWIILGTPFALVVGALLAAWIPAARAFLGTMAGREPVARAGLLAVAGVAGAIGLARLLQLKAVDPGSNLQATGFAVAVLAFCLGLAAASWPTRGRPGALLGAASMAVQALIPAWLILVALNREPGTQVLVAALGAIVATAWALVVLSRHRTPVVAAAAAILLVQQGSLIVHVLASVTDLGDTALGTLSLLPAVVVALPAAVLALRGNRPAAAALGVTVVLTAATAMVAGPRPSGLITRLMFLELPLGGETGNRLGVPLLWAAVLAGLLLTLAAAAAMAPGGGSAGVAVLAVVALVLPVRYGQGGNAALLWGLAGLAAVVGLGLAAAAAARARNAEPAEEPAPVVT